MKSSSADSTACMTRSILLHHFSVVKHYVRKERQKVLALLSKTCYNTGNLGNEERDGTKFR
jgi:hypothetical protein